MTDSFKGFSPGKPNTVAVHTQFFSEVLPLVDDLAEMKVLLFCYRALLQKSGTYRYLVRDDFLEDESLRQGLAVIEEDIEAALQRGLQRALEHRVLLAAEVEGQIFYFMNTVKGQAAVRQIAAGQFIPDTGNRVEILPERPTIFRLYEENIGQITPMLVDDLKDAEDEFPYEWLEDAMKIAVEQNKRSWKYVRAVLERWQKEGRNHETLERSGSTNGGFAGHRWSDYAE
ncbi:MAG: DnaD domain protein [Anaerolineae bacterium]|nr:DnaD domain protein [Anaerolineae bacterium]